MGFDVKDKVALVTGANRGIGKAIVEKLLAEGVKKLYAAVRDLDSVHPLVEKHGGVIVPIELDLKKPDTITATAKSASDAELVVSNAGILKVAAPMDSDAIDKLQEEFEVNVLGLMRMAQAFAPVLKANGGGAFVQLNSVASLRSFPPFCTYCASKAASYSLTQALRGPFGEQGTALLSVHPGPIGTDMADHAGFEESEPPSVVADAIVEALAKGEFRAFPDSMAKQVGAAYEQFARHVVDEEIEA